MTRGAPVLPRGDCLHNRPGNVRTRPAHGSMPGRKTTVGTVAVAPLFRSTIRGFRSMETTAVRRPAVRPRSGRPLLTPLRAATRPTVGLFAHNVHGSFCIYAVIQTPQTKGLRFSPPHCFPVSSFTTIIMMPHCDLSMSRGNVIDHNRGHLNRPGPFGMDHIHECHHPGLEADIDLSHPVLKVETPKHGNKTETLLLV